MFIYYNYKIKKKLFIKNYECMILNNKINIKLNKYYPHNIIIYKN